MGGKQPSLEGHKSGQSNEPLSAPAHALSFQQVIEETKCNPDDGLATSEAKSRLEKFGSNDLGDDGGVQPAKILLRQVANSMTLVGTLMVCNPEKANVDISQGAYRSYGSQFCH
jgi:magnesium-transporting ATPase (P-type)